MTLNMDQVDDLRICMDKLDRSYCYCKLDGHNNEDLAISVNEYLICPTTIPDDL